MKTCVYICKFKPVNHICKNRCLSGNILLTINESNKPDMADKKKLPPTRCATWDHVTIKLDCLHLAKVKAAEGQTRLISTNVDAV